MAHDLFGSVRLGKPCAWHKSGLCARVDDWTRKLENPGDFTVAKCKNGTSIETTIAAVKPPAASQGEFSSDSRAHMPWSKVELMPMDGGVDRVCRGVMQIQTGHVSRLYNIWTAENIEDCKALCTDACKGIEFQAEGKYCEVWYGDVLFSAASPGFECHVKKDQDLSAKLAMVRPKDETCLRAEPQGCAAIKDRFSCLSSKDGSKKGDVLGLKVTDEPCIWCGGGLCHSGSTSMCEPFDYLLRGEGKDHAFGSFTASGTFESPSCKDGKASVFTQQDTWWQPERPLEAQLTELTPVAGGCESVKEMATCLTSKDGSPNATWGFTPYKVQGEACVWCGGVPCTDASASLCMPFDLAMNGLGPHHTTFYAKHSFKVATIKASENVVSADMEVSCLSHDNTGCNTLTDAYKCLASADGRPNATIFGRKVGGQPCVWCNGRQCNSEGGLCEAYDLQMNGEGYVFATSFDKQPMVAQCEAGTIKAHAGVPSVVLTLPDPKMDDLGCLTEQPAGCMAITNKMDCLSSTDGSAGASYGGLKLRGQPCVWCGSVACTDGGSFQCAPFDYLVNGAGKVFPHVTAAAATVAQCHAESRTFPTEETACLKVAETGCNEIRDMTTCVSSREGRPYEFIAGFKVKGEPCVWCGGGQCNTAAPTLCEPYDYAVNGAGHAFNTQLSTSLYTRAACDKDNQPGPVKLPSQIQLHGYHQSVQCGHPNPVWMKVGQTCGFCKALVPSIKEQFATCADYCAAQGGLRCKSTASADLGSCDPKAAVACDAVFEDYTHGLCECEPSTNQFKEANAAFAAGVTLPKADQCLNAVETGCGSIKDKLICLSSKDGSSQAEYRGTKIAGQACAWCGGVACTSHDPDVKCVALDFLVNGQGPAYATRHVAAGSVDVAGCDKAQAARTFKNVGCLKRAEQGCNALKNQTSCLASVDGRPYTQIAGLKVEGQPCVWCGGLPCTTNNGNLCEPYEFVTHGEGHAYDFNNELNFFTAACEEGQPVQHTLTSAIAIAGVTTAVDCGFPNPLWRGIGKTCGFCKVQVAVEAAKSYTTCEKFCQAQGGLACQKAFQGHLHSCDNGPEMTCTMEFQPENSPLCECGAPSVKETDANLNFVAALPRPDQASIECLVSAASGCGVLTDRNSCLSHKDGGDTADYRGLALAGEPCVWCGGGACTGHSDAKCAAYDFLANGMGLAFETRQAVSAMDVAHCKAPTRVWSNTGCLAKVSDGCNSLTDQQSCLASKDGRPYTQIAGLKVEDQPCVWCGGVTCHENGHLCEPYEYAMNGEGHAYDAPSARSTFFTAACEAGKPVQHMLPGAMVEAGVPLQVDCGVPNPTWDKVGRSCGFCKVQVAKEAAPMFKTCAGYCQGQGNLTCAKAWAGNPFSCDTSSEKTCTAEFAEGELPVCECNPGAEKVTASAAAFTVPRPTEEQMNCLYTAEAGCGSLTDELECLSHKDGGSMTEIKGLKLTGEACVWCGGGACTDHSASKCVAYDFLARGQGLVFTTRVSPVVAQAAMCKEPHRDFGNIDCLKRVTDGCNTLQDQKSCLASYDGRPYTQVKGFKVEGQPCIWCGGVPCTHQGNLCEPYEFGKFSGESSAWWTASCENGKPVEHETASNLANYGTTVPVKCGAPEPVWYKVGRNCGFCKVQVAISAAPTYKNCDTYCMAQGNLTCKAAWTGFQHSCDVKSEIGCSDTFPANNAPVCECKPAVKQVFKNEPRPTQVQMSCLKDEGLGCFAISDRLNCLSSKDASNAVAKEGLKIHGEPCVWCGDGACTSDSTARCAPYDWFVRGEGLAYTMAHAAAKTNFDVAKCKNDEDAVFKNVQCLAPHEGGCNTIQDEHTCLSSKDGRPYEFVAGFKARGQPCVWCGGTQCHSANDNKCEPYDFAVNGEGHAFNTFHASGSWKMAACEGGRVVSHTLPSLFVHGTNLQVQCGYGPLALWSHTSRTCGECRVNVPQIQDNFKTCSHYCGRQPGAPMCLGASIAHHPNSCDINTPANCDYEFKKEEDGICKCSVVKPPHERIQKLYGQCGGKNWKGYVQCQMGAICNVVNDWYSQCQPALSAQPGVKVHVPEEETLGVDEEEVAASMAAGAGAAVGGAAVVGAAAGAATHQEPNHVVVHGGDSSNVVVAPVVIPAVRAPAMHSRSAPAVQTPAVQTPAVHTPAVQTPVAAPLSVEPPKPVEIVTPEPLKPVAVATPEPVAMAEVATPKPVATAEVVTPKPVAMAEVVTPKPLEPVEPVTMAPVAVATPEPVKAAAVELTSLKPLEPVAVAAVATPEPLVAAGAAAGAVDVGAVTTPEMPKPLSVEITTPKPLEIGTLAPLDLTTPEMPKVPKVAIPAVTTPELPKPVAVEISTPKPLTPVAVTTPYVQVGLVVTPPPIRSKDGAVEASTAAIGGETAQAQAASTPEPLSYSVQAGLNAAALKRDDHGTVEQQAVAAAGTTGAYEVARLYSTQEVAKDKATEVAKRVYTEFGQLPEPQAEIEAEKAMKKALEAAGGEFVGPDLLQRHGFADCYEKCGNKPGYCPDFCGRGNACCRETGDIVVPPECRGVYNFYTPHYECIKPTAIYMPVKSRDANNETAGVVVAPETVSEGTAAAQPDDGFSAWQWILIGATILALLCAAVVCWTLSEGNKRALALKSTSTRGVDVATPRSGNGDLELQAPLTGAAAFGASAAVAAPIVSQQYRFLPGPPQGYQPAPMQPMQDVRMGMGAPVTSIRSVAPAQITSGYLPVAQSSVVSTPVPMEPMMPMEPTMAQASSSSVAAQGPATVCVNCGNVYAADSVFCRKCGQKRP